MMNILILRQKSISFSHQIISFRPQLPIPRSVVPRLEKVRDYSAVQRRSLLTKVAHGGNPHERLTNPKGDATGTLGLAEKHSQKTE
ncbi:hypothetical protein [Cyanothece sp. BG0011]|uniref:hypothetical protein n=1 Tax=Cyanothece sp. BG0011 TaxID=2082950 RepID=UPI001300679F|nr:hypothetical protein [Cyanothece sp. BG0011]